MKTKKFKCDLNPLSNWMRLKKPIFNNLVNIEVNGAKIWLGHYMLYRLRDWIDAAIKEIESDKNKSVKSVAKSK